MDLDNEKIRKMVIEDLSERVAILEHEILLLEADPTDRELIDSIFRHFHTIKGTAGMGRLKNLAEYSHHMENLLACIRDGTVPVTAEIVSLYLESIDCLRNHIDVATDEAALDRILIQKNLETVMTYLPDRKAEPVVWPPMEEDCDTSLPDDAYAPGTTLGASETEQFTRTYCVHFTFDSTFLTKIKAFEKILSEFRSWGECGMNASLEDMRTALELDEKGTLPLELFVTTSKSQTSLELLIDYHLGKIDFWIDILPCPPPMHAQPRPNSEDASYQPLGNILIQRQAVHPDDVQSALKEQKPLGRILLEKGKLEVAELNTALKVQEKQKRKYVSMQKAQTSSSIRVDIAKLDKLLNLVGEATIIQFRYARLTEHIEDVLEREQYMQQILEDQSSPEEEYHQKTVDLLRTLEENLRQSLNQGERIMRELQEQSMRVRMIPIGSLFSPFTRLVRDYNLQHGKNIKLVIRGEDTELDKTLVEKLDGPLKHLVRNAMDHGIEMPMERETAGKEIIGSITLDAFHREGMVIIEITDDGRGIDPEKVKAAAMKKGIFLNASEYKEEELFQLLFLPGVSTSESVSDVSGRGVGLDVAKREIEALHGKIEIKSKPGKGTTFRIRLPLTLSIIDGMLVSIGDNSFIIPLFSIIESLKPSASQVKTVKGKGEFIDVRGEYIPLLRLHNLFHLRPTARNPAEGIVVIVEEMGGRCCLLIDEIIDQQQTVIKSLEENFFRVDSIAGATILGNGHVCLILDIPGLIKAKKYPRYSALSTEVANATG